MLPVRVPVAGADLVLLAVEVLLAPVESGVLAQLPSGVDPVRARQRRREHRADHERRPAVVEVVRVDVRRVRERVRPEVLAHLRLRELAEVLAQLPGRLAPGEVRVALGEADLRQQPHHLRLRERLGEEDHVGVVGLDLANEPCPERDRLRVRVVDPKDPHAVTDPDLEDPLPLAPQGGARRRVARR